jgi:hypothetical protein
MVNVFNDVLVIKIIVKLGYYVKHGSLYLIVKSKQVPCLVKH